MLLPLVLLAIGSAAVGFIDIPRFIAPVIHVAEHAGTESVHWITGLALASAVLGIGGASFLYLRRPELAKGFAETFAPLRRVLENKWGFDLAYDWFARRIVVQGSADVLWKVFDVKIIDGAVNGAAALTERAAQASRTVQSGLVRAYVVLILGGSVILLSYLLWMGR
jgi:NADH-quinone oxidoreductase subunit L